MARSEWLSEGAEKLAHELLRQRDTGNAHCEIAIVGSGYGGAVAAARLAGAAKKNAGSPSVWVLERGREFVPGDFPERFADLIGETRVHSAGRTFGLRLGLFDLRLGRDVSALLGNGLGGGSLINAGVLARPDANVMARAPWPSAFANRALEPYFSAAEKMLGATRLPGRAPDKLAELEHLAARISEARGERAKIAVTFERTNGIGGIELKPCLQCGDCFTGCNHWAKNTLAMNYLPLARLRGARLFTGVTVLSVSPWRDGWSLELDFTDEQIRKRFGEAPPALRAERVILAAGAYGSPAILMRSRKKGFAALSARNLGRRFSTNGDMIAIAVGAPRAVRASSSESIAPGARGIGPTIAGMIDLRHRPTPFVIEELAIPAALRRAFEEIVTTFGALHGLEKFDWSVHRAGPGRDPAAIDAEAIDRTSVYATIGDDDAAGRLILRKSTAADADRQDDAVQVLWKDVASKDVFVDAMKVLGDAYRDEATVIPNPMWKLLPSGIGQVLDEGEIGGSVFTVHPLGGCAMADSGRDGVVNHKGQVFSGAQGTAVHKTLVVLDGSMVPSALGTNPCLTIAALAEHAVCGLAKDWGLLLPGEQLAGTAGGANDLGKPPKKNLQASPPRATAIRLAERLTGALTLDDVKYQAELDIRYREVPDLETFLSGPSRTLELAEGRLLFRGVDSDQIEREISVRIEGRLRFLERVPTTALGRVCSAGRAWLVNRGWRELIQAMLGMLRGWRELIQAILGMLRGWLRKLFFWLPPDRKKPGGSRLRRIVCGWLALASQAGEQRMMRYELVVAGEPGAQAWKPAPLSPGDRLCGTKRIAYVASGPLQNPWEQLTKLPLDLRRKGSRSKIRLGELEVDLPFFVLHHATQLQIAAQEDQPRAIAALFSLAAYVARVVGKIHIWGLRAPDYPDPYPLYEFTRKETARARRAALQVVEKTERRLRRRLPGPVAGLKRKVFCLVPRDDPNRRSSARLTRYRPAAGAGLPRVKRLGPALLIHGFGASGNTFTLPTVEENLVQHLAKQGYEPWVLDLRTSIALPSSKQDLSFDEVALHDIPLAIETMRKHSPDEPVQVVAHCIGAAMFTMAALAGKLPAGSVRAAVLSQVGPLIELPPTNRFRGFVAGYLRHYLNIEELDTTASLTPFNRFVDRVLALLPYPRHEQSVHRDAPVTGRHEAFCRRTYGIYGRLFEHASLNAQTLATLGDYLGHVRYRTYQQTIFYATQRRLTDESGANRYVTYENIKRHLDFPICLLHGEKNEVFSKRTSERSFDLLASIFWSKDLNDLWDSEPARRYDYSLYAKGRRLRIVEIEGYGHQDCMIGANAHEKVYPQISAFFRECLPSGKPIDPLIVVRPPRLGPILGWVRSATGGARNLARILLAPNDSRSAPIGAMTIVLRSGEHVSGHARFHDLDSGADSPTVALDVELPEEPADYCIVVVTVHREQYEPEPAKDATQPRGDDPFGEDLDRIPVPAIEIAPNARLSAIDAEPYAKGVLQTCKDLWITQDRHEPIVTGARVAHKRYAMPVSTAFLSRPTLEAARRSTPDKADAITFALASCRYAASVADREAADEAFGRLRKRLESANAGAPQLLFLAGDAIYADATYGIFDPRSPKDRFDLRYLEAWSAPNAREVLRRVPVYPILDDHEVEDNFEGAEVAEEQKRTLLEHGLAAFEAFQLRLTPAFATTVQTRPNDAYWYVAQAGGFEFFVADTRTERCRLAGLRSGAATIVGHKQMRALQDWLQRMQAADSSIPKFIVSPSVVAPWFRETGGDRAYALRSDAWDGFPESLRELLEFIASHQIRNVVFLSGDYHCSAWCEMRLSLRGKPEVPAFSIVSSGLYAPYPFANTRFHDLEDTFDGAFASRFHRAAKAKPDQLMVHYHAHRIDCRDSFALVGVRREQGQRALQVEFDSGHAVPPIALD